MVDPSGIVLSWNKGAEIISGYEAHEVIGVSKVIFYTPEDIQKNIPFYDLDQTLKNGHHYCEGWRIRKDGSRFWAEINLTTIHDKEGRLKGFAVITKETTQLKLAQEQISSQARLIEDISDAIFSTDQDYIIRSWNKAAEQLYGYPAIETIGKAANDIVRTPLSQEARAGIRQFLLEHGYWKGEVFHLHKDGSPLTLLYSISMIRGKQGKPDGYVMACRDITERKKMEIQLKAFNAELESVVLQKTSELTTVFERVSDAIMAFDRSGRITYVNHMAAHLNRRKPEELIGQSFWELFPSAAGNEFGHNFHLAISTQRNIHFEMFSPSLQLWIECYLYPSPDGLSFFFHDVTEKKLAEETIRRSNDELRQLASHLQDIREDERATIAREIHDELGQQLTGIKIDLTWIHRKRDSIPDESLYHRLTDTMALLDNSIRTVRRIATELRPSVIDDLGLIAAIEWHSQEFQRRSGIKVSFCSSPPDLQFDPAISIGLFRICQESLTNVARHSNATQVSIDLDQADNLLTLTIQDNGKGLDMDSKENNKTIGLLGMKERALMMGGRLEVDSQPGAGLTLKATIPYYPK